MQAIRHKLALRARPPLAALVCGLCLAAGCNGDRPETAPVSGVVEFNGKPITGFEHGAVTFTPQGGPMAKGIIDPANGSFQLTTYKEGDGALVGPARVTVSATVDDPRASADEKHPGVKWVTPASFADRDQSGLTCEVKADKKNVFRIKISSNGSGTVEAE